VSGSDVGGLVRVLAKATERSLARLFAQPENLAVDVHVVDLRDDAAPWPRPSASRRLVTCQNEPVIVLGGLCKIEALCLIYYAKYNLIAGNVDLCPRAYRR
jgi:hypothetical protein